VTIVRRALSALRRLAFSVYESDLFVQAAARAFGFARSALFTC